MGSRLLPVVSSETAGVGHGLEPSDVHRHDVAGRPVAVYRIVIHEKTGRLERR